MQLSNLEYLPNHIITERLDVVYGNTVRSKHVGKDFLSGLKNIVGSELTTYTELLEEARQEAMNRMITKAQSIEALMRLSVFVFNIKYHRRRIRAFCLWYGGQSTKKFDPFGQKLDELPVG